MDDTFLILFYLVFGTFLFITINFIILTMAYIVISLRRQIRNNETRRCLIDMYQHGLTPSEVYLVKLTK